MGRKFENDTLTFETDLSELFPAETGETRERIIFYTCLAIVCAIAVYAIGGEVLKAL